ncbi:TetR/AcrR family transcriptional regulator [Methanoregula sp.]|uniref:TetR/AcrR family transcriptional regulator n=1 Tax=Methanoregula sp. TaxID=2052170 RepID=UPI00236CA072|nr:TetR/AcrR family transcriptional regulator [Methanoregula sp.]MDD1686986.1 TetR/AcrR family transcriptional regulator [Methanoregula sp.]
MREPGPDKQEAILATALTLFTERGFFGTPTSLISKEAGVATGTLFFYFKTKEDLIDTLYRQVKSEAALAMCRGIEKEKTAQAKLQRLGHNAVAWGIQNPAKMKFMEQFAHSPFVSTSAHEEGMSHFLFLKDLVQDGIKKGEIRTVEPMLLFCMMASAFSGLIASASLAETADERVKIIDEGLDFIWNGMKA